MTFFSQSFQTTQEMNAYQFNNEINNKQDGFDIFNPEIAGMALNSSPPRRRLVQTPPRLVVVPTHAAPTPISSAITPSTITIDAISQQQIAMLQAQLAAERARIDELREEKETLAERNGELYEETKVLRRDLMSAFKQLVKQSGKRRSHDEIAEDSDSEEAVAPTGRIPAGKAPRIVEPNQVPLRQSQKTVVYYHSHAPAQQQESDSELEQEPEQFERQEAERRQPEQEDAPKIVRANFGVGEKSIFELTPEEVRMRVAANLEENADLQVPDVAALASPIEDALAGPQAMAEDIAAAAAAQERAVSAPALIVQEEVVLSGQSLVPQQPQQLPVQQMVGQQLADQQLAGESAWDQATFGLTGPYHLVEPNSRSRTRLAAERGRARFVGDAAEMELAQRLFCANNVMAVTQKASKFAWYTVRGVGSTDKPMYEDLFTEADVTVMVVERRAWVCTPAALAEAVRTQDLTTSLPLFNDFEHQLLPQPLKAVQEEFRSIMQPKSFRWRYAEGMVVFVKNYKPTKRDELLIWANLERPATTKQITMAAPAGTVSRMWVENPDGSFVCPLGRRFYKVDSREVLFASLASCFEQAT